MSINTGFALVLIAGFALFGAGFLEYGMGLAPCELCLYQRLPWFAILFAVPFLANPFSNNGSNNSIISGKLVRNVCVVALVLGFGVASYQALLEWGLVTGTDECGSPVPIFPSIGRSNILPSFVSCSQAPLRIAGISPAGYNALLSLLTLLVIFLRRRK